MSDTTNGKVPAAPAKISDGFDGTDDDGSRSIIRGSKAKFGNDGKWTDGAGDVIAPTREFIVVELVKVSQKWIDDKPADTRVIAPDEHFPDVERLNEEAPKTEWREKFGKLIGPWQNCIAVYLFDPATMEGYTWPTSTAGGFRCVSELKGAVHRARMMQHGDNVYPVVTLADTHMNTAYGGRQRPKFKVLRFITLGGQAKPLLEPAKPKPSLREQLNDDIPF
jgi:hypothetical protein